MTDYITSEEFLNTAPQNLTVPEDTPSGASFVSSSILLLFSALAFVLFVFN